MFRSAPLALLINVESGAATILVLVTLFFAARFHRKSHAVIPKKFFDLCPFFAGHSGPFFRKIRGAVFRPSSRRVPD